MAETSHLPESTEAVRTESKLVRSTAQEMRVNALRVKISLGLTFCTLAENAMQNGDANLPLALIQRAQNIGIHVQRHVNHPDHVPASAAEELRAELKQLEGRVLSIATKIKSNDPVAR